ncbi:MAG: cysteine dioxygenase family protein, partial [Planctomycetota bacterium]
MAEEHLDLDGLRAELNRYPDGTPMDVLYGLLQRVQVSCEDVASSISFGDEEYERNPICSGPGWELVCICWRPGQTSPVHDHRGSGCGILVLRGTLTETVFETTKDGPMTKTGSRDLHQ